MKAIKVGDHYIAEIGNKETTVIVDKIIKNFSTLTQSYLSTYYVINLQTGRKTTFSGTSRFLREAQTQ